MPSDEDMNRPTTASLERDLVEAALWLATARVVPTDDPERPDSSEYDAAWSEVARIATALLAAREERKCN